MHWIGAAGLVACAMTVFWSIQIVLRRVAEFRFAPCATLSVLWLMAGSAVIGRLLPNLVIATLMTAAIAGAIALAVHKWTTELPRGERSRHRVPFGAWVVGGIIAFLVSWGTLTGIFYDEWGHNGITAVIARGVIPPEFPLFPGAPFRYHYGFDVLAGQVLAFTGVPVHRAIDVATLVCLALLLVSLYTFGHQFGGRAGALLALGIGLLGGSVLQIFWLFETIPIEPRRAWHLVGSHGAEMPTVVAHFFQHPQGLGQALAPGVLAMIFAPGDSPRPRLRRYLSAFMVGMLSLAHSVFFLMLGVAFVVSLGLEFLTPRAKLRHLVDTIACGFIVAGTARLLGGFFAPHASSNHYLVFRRYWDVPVWNLVCRYVGYFGLPLLALVPYAIFGWRSRRPERIALAVSAIVAFLIPNFVSYERSWDIIKFYSVGTFLANIALADFTCALALRLGRHASAALFLAVVAVTTPTGLLWLVRMSVLNGRLDSPPLYLTPPLKNDVMALARDAGRVIPPRDRVLAPGQWDIPLFTGFLSPGFDWRGTGDGFAMDRDDQDRMLMAAIRARRNLRLQDLEILDVNWLIMPLNLSPTGRANLQNDWTFVLETGTRDHRYQLYRRKIQTNP